MLKKYSICLIAAFSFFLWIEDDSVHSRSTEPPAFNSSAPGQSSCSGSSCHGVGDPDVGGGSVIIVLGDGTQTQFSRESDMPIDIEVIINDDVAIRHGFQMSVLDNDGNSVGNFITDGVVVGTQNSQGIQFVNHINAPNPNNNAFTFQWDAENFVGDVTFYATGIAANGANGPMGDNRYTASNQATVITMAGIEDDLANFDIYPNPTTDILKLDRLPFDYVDLTISNLSGTTVLAGKFQSSETLDLAQLTPGLYLLSLQVDSYRMTQKLIVK